MFTKMVKFILIPISFNIILFFWTVSQWVNLAPNFNCGLVKFTYGPTGKCGFIDKKGHIVIPPVMPALIVLVKTVWPTLKWMNTPEGGLIKKERWSRVT
jgi:hypothetical protein